MLVPTAKSQFLVSSPLNLTPRSNQTHSNMAPVPLFNHLQPLWPHPFLPNMLPASTRSIFTLESFDFFLRLVKQSQTFMVLVLELSKLQCKEQQY